MIENISRLEHDFEAARSGKRSYRPVGPQQISGALTPSRSKQDFNAKKRKLAKLAKKASMALCAVLGWAPRGEGLCFFAAFGVLPVLCVDLTCSRADVARLRTVDV
jgi:hypothetical protein